MNDPSLILIDFDPEVERRLAVEDGKDVLDRFVKLVFHALTSFLREREGLFAVPGGSVLDRMVPGIVISLGDFTVPEHVPFEAFLDEALERGADDDGFLVFGKCFCIAVIDIE